MQSLASRLRQSASVKVFTIGFLILVLLIPLQMVRGTINDRSQIHETARLDIQRTWGHSQMIAGPVLVVPYDATHTNDRGDLATRTTEVYVLPETLQIDSNIDSEIRYRGIHEVPVYSATASLKGRFASVDAAELGIDSNRIHWADAFVAIGISDGRAITETPSLSLEDRSIPFAPGGQLIDGLPPQIQAPLGAGAASDLSTPLSFEIELKFNGSESLYFLPFGDSTQVSVTSTWPSPSFAGRYLPHTREVADSGFTADWSVPSIGRTLPSRWTKHSTAAASATSSAFGVDLYMPIGIYRLTLRAVKYGALFVVLTFVSYFLFETVAGLRLHPLQYLMVGLANTMFFLLLISLAEHIGFGWAYVVSTVGSSALVVGYSHAILGNRGRAGIVGGVLLFLYGFLYMTLQAETYALLAGAIGLWATLATIMFLTRRIDWYAMSETTPRRSPDEKQEALDL